MKRPLPGSRSMCRTFGLAASIWLGLGILAASAQTPTDRTVDDPDPDSGTAPAVEPNANGGRERARAGAGPFAEFISALRKGETNRAFAILDKLPEDHPAYIATLSNAAELLSENRLFSRALPIAERVYRKAPDNMDVVHTYIRANLLAGSNLTQNVVARPPLAPIPPEFQFITGPIGFEDESPTRSKQSLLADLDFLERILANAYSYAERSGSDWRTALDALRSSVNAVERTPINTFNYRIQRFLTLFGDPHTAVRTSLSKFFPRGFAAFVPEVDGDRVLAVRPSRKGFVDDACRYVESIDGVTISNWLRVAALDVPRASPQFAREQTVGRLILIAHLRAQLRLPLTNDVLLGLVSADGTQRTNVRVSFSLKPVEVARVSRGDSRRLETDLGYLRIRSMDAQKAFLDELDKRMAEFRGTRGLIIDVRGNGGGTQDALRRLMPYFLEPAGPTRLVNVAAYRLPVKLPRPCAEGYLGISDRGLYPLTSKKWSEAERGQIRSLLSGFAPSWQPPAGQFSEWHVMGIRPGSNPKAYSYTNQVIVLMNARCFSATDNFLGALKGLPNVTLMGTASGGGSGRMAQFTLPQTRLSLTVCQMASYRANGDIFDGRGVAPDVEVAPRPEDFLAGKGDSVLEAAIQRLNRVKGR